MEWQSINTAPTNRNVIVWSKAIGNPCVAQRDVHTGRWYDEAGEWELKDDELPTHWMPLPEPPKA